MIQGLILLNHREKKMPQWIDFGQGMAAFLGAVTSFVAAFLTYKIKINKQTNKIWQDFFDDNMKFRDEIRKDLSNVKEERDSLTSKIIVMEEKMNAIIKENLLLKEKEMNLRFEIKKLQEENVLLKSEIADLKKFKCKLGQDCEIKNSIKS